MNIMKMTIVAALLLALTGCIVEPFGGPGYYGQDRGGGYGGDYGGGGHDHH